MITIHIPTPLRAYTEKNASVVVEAKTVQEAVDALLASYPALAKRNFVNFCHFLSLEMRVGHWTKHI